MSESKDYGQNQSSIWGSKANTLHNINLLNNNSSNNLNNSSNNNIINTISSNNFNEFIRKLSFED